MRFLFFGTGGTHAVTLATLKQAINEPVKDSHKGQNGTLLVVGGSPYFHGAGRLAATGATETIQALSTIIDFGSKYNDYVIVFCTSDSNLKLLQARHDAFIGVTRQQIDQYLKISDAVIVGPGLMREEEKGDPATKNEPEITLELTQKVLASGKKAVLDAGSLQVITPEQLQDRKHIIITPHRTEMARLFAIEEKTIHINHDASFKEIRNVAHIVQNIAKTYRITILLKGPIDIIANETNWYYATGGDPAMTKGGTGDVLAGVVASLYTRTDDPLLAAAAGSYLTKKAGEMLRETSGQFFNATDLAHEIHPAIIVLLQSRDKK